MPRHPAASPAALRAAEDHVAGELGAAGLRVERQLFAWGAREFHNVLGTLDGTDPARPWVVVGAHFDSVARSPGADDNASGVAAMLEAARLLVPRAPAATVQFVGFNLEEIQNPFGALRLGNDVHALGSFRIGSRAYARRLRARGQAVAGALVLEMLGFTGPGGGCAPCASWRRCRRRGLPRGDRRRRLARPPRRVRARGRWPGPPGAGDGAAPRMDRPRSSVAPTTPGSGTRLSGAPSSPIRRSSATRTTTARAIRRRRSTTSSSRGGRRRWCGACWISQNQGEKVMR